MSTRSRITIPGNRSIPLCVVRTAAVVALVTSTALAAEVRGAKAQDAKPAAAAIIQATIDREGALAARTKLDDLLVHPDQYSFSQRDISALGLRYLQRKAFPEAIAVFEFNERRFPDSYDAVYNLIQAHLAAGDTARVDRTLGAWLARRPKAETIEQRVAKSPAFAKRYEDERRGSFRPGQSTGVQGPYFGQVPPGTTPQVFAPGIVSLISTREYACSMSPDGREFYFTRRGTGQTILVSRLEPGGWTFPEPVTFSAGFTAHEPHVTHDNKRIYWGWSRPPAGSSTGPASGIYVSERTPTGWSEARYVGQGMNVNSTRDGRLFMSVDGLVQVPLVDSRFGTPERLRGGMETLASTFGGHPAHPALAPDGSYIVFDVLGGPHLFVCFRNIDGTWGEAIDLADHGISAEGGIASISPDGKYLFYGFEDDIYWVSTKLIEDLRPGATRK